VILEPLNFVSSPQARLIGFRERNRRWTACTNPAELDPASSGVTGDLDQMLGYLIALKAGELAHASG
jgi:hypothetical protein